MKKFTFIYLFALLCFSAAVKKQKDAEIDPKSLDSQKKMEDNDYTYLSETGQAGDNVAETNGINEKVKVTGDKRILKEYIPRGSLLNLLLKMASNETVRELADMAGVGDTHNTVRGTNFEPTNNGTKTHIFVKNSDPSVLDANDWSDARNKARLLDNYWTSPLERNAMETLDNDTFREDFIVEMKDVAIEENSTNSGQRETGNFGVLLDAFSDENTNNESTHVNAQARFGCFGGTVCNPTTCGKYAILPDGYSVCCIFCSVLPTLFPDPRDPHGGYTCTCSYFGFT